jgi:hypothetical protein
VEAPCPGWLSGSHIGKLVLVLLILLVMSLLVVVIGSKSEGGGALGGCIQSLRARFFGGSSRYSLVGGKHGAMHSASNTHSMAEDEAFYLSEDEFGPSPHLIDGETGEARSRHAATTASAAAIRPLPTSTKARSSVPTIAPPSQ